MNTTGNSTPLPGDNPIEGPTKDVLDRSGRAAAFARQVLELDASHGTTVGVFGPWGSGKTSFVNLAQRTFEEMGGLVLDFNPWLFSGAQQLVERFFAELSARMGVTDELREIGDALGKYGAALNAVAGVASALLAVPQISAIVTKLTEAAVDASQPESVNALRYRLESELQKRGKPIVVVLDDVDRLSAPEIREVFKLVRLTASFPNLIYIVSCDRLRVEQALGEETQGLSGRDYLEKIIQWSYNVPEVPSHLLTQQLYKAIEHALAGIKKPGPFDEDAWTDIRADIVRPLIRNMRDVRRYAIAIRETVGGLDGEVSLADILALEAIRLFLPDVFRRLPGAIDGLTGMTRAVDRHIDRMNLQFLESPFPRLSKALKAQVDGVIAAAGNDLDPNAARTKEVVVATVDHLFPVGARLRNMGDGDSDLCLNDDAKVELVLLVGHRENSGHKLVTQTAAGGFESMLRNEIRAAPADELAEERDPSRVLIFAKHYGGPADEPLYIDDSPNLTFALLRSAHGEMQSGLWGSRAVRRTAVLNLPHLIDLYGSEEVLATRINDLKAGFDALKPWIATRGVSLDEAEQLLELVERYLSGWRPSTD